MGVVNVRRTSEMLVEDKDHNMPRRKISTRKLGGFVRPRPLHEYAMLENDAAQTKVELHVASTSNLFETPVSRART